MKTNQKTVLISIIGSLVMIGLAIALVAIAIENKPEPEVDTRAASLLQVEVVPISVSAYAPVIQIQGTVQARYTGNLVSQVEGQVLEVSEKLLAGNEFEQGEVLVKLDAIRYLSNRASAQSELAARQFDLMEEQLRVKQAKADWKRAGIKDQEPSALTLREPQLKSAQAQVAAAKSALTLASQDLKHTQVAAPYSGSVIARHVSPGDYVQIGQTLAETYANNSLELRLPLSEAQINVLGNRNTILPRNITVSTTDSTQRHWSVSSWRLGRTIDQTNHWQQLIVELETDATNAPLPGEFLQAHIEGPLMNGLLELNQASLTRDGRVWYVNDNSELAYFNAWVVFRRNDKVYVKPPDETAHIKVIAYPQSDLLAGTRVESTYDSGLSNNTKTQGNKTL